MRATLLAVPVILASLAPSPAHGEVAVSVGVQLPGLTVGVATPGAFVAVPGLPVLYAPRAEANVFYAEGVYWSFAGDRWWSCAHHGGPWHEVTPAYVPTAVLRVPVGYYRRPPTWFAGWHRGAPPRWSDRWGRGWEARRHDAWERPGRWEHAAVHETRPEVRQEVRQEVRHDRVAVEHDAGRGHGGHDAHDGRGHAEHDRGDQGHRHGGR